LGLLLSARRTGGMPSALFDIGAQMVADVEVILKGLPPVVYRNATRETVARFPQKTDIGGPIHALRAQKFDLAPHKT
jgi:hypothetical protein